MNDINKMPPVCAYCPYWEVCKPPYICPDIGDKKPKRTNERTEAEQNVSDSDLISRKAAMNRIDEALARVFVESRGCGEYILRKLPSVKPERNRGHWVGIDDEPCDVYECDRCGTTYDTVDSTWDLPNYCPNCGADMREVDDETD